MLDIVPVPYAEYAYIDGEFLIRVNLLTNEINTIDYYMPTNEECTAFGTEIDTTSSWGTVPRSVDITNSIALVEGSSICNHQLRKHWANVLQNDTRDFECEKVGDVYMYILGRHIDITTHSARLLSLDNLGDVVTLYGSCSDFFAFMFLFFWGFMYKQVVMVASFGKFDGINSTYPYPMPLYVICGSYRKDTNIISLVKPSNFKRIILYQYVSKYQNFNVVGPYEHSMAYVLEDTYTEHASSHDDDTIIHRSCIQDLWWADSDYLYDYSTPYEIFIPPFMSILNKDDMPKLFTELDARVDNIKGVGNHTITDISDTNAQPITVIIPRAYKAIEIQRNAY